MESVERSSKIDNCPVSIDTFRLCNRLTLIQKSKFHVGDEVYTSIVDYRGLLQRQGPYLIAEVLGGGKYTLCYYNGDIAESGKGMDEKTLVAA